MILWERDYIFMKACETMAEIANIHLHMIDCDQHRFDDVYVLEEVRELRSDTVFVEIEQ